MKNETPKAESPLMDSSEAARLTGLHRRTITRLCEQKAFPAVRIGRQWRINREKFMTYIGL